MTAFFRALALLVAPLSMGLAGCHAPAAPSAAVAAAPASVSVSGLVARHDGAGFIPLAGATIRVEGHAASAVTDARGHYALTGLPAGSLRLRIEAAGHAPVLLKATVSPVGGLGRVNAALAPRAYGLKQASAVTAVSGVITDPRGAALPHATVRLRCAGANGGAGADLTLQSDANGFYAAALAGVLPNATVEVDASGTSPGGVALSASAPASEATSGQRLVLNCTADSFPTLPTPAIVGSSLVLAGDEATVRVANVSTRTDEFYLRLKSGDAVLDVLPSAVIGDAVRFRVPMTLPDAGFEVEVVPFGQTAKATPPSPGFISIDYQLADFDADMRYVADSALQDLTAPSGVINGQHFIGGDQARYTLTLANASTLLAHQLEIKGSVTPGATIVSASANGVAITGANLVQPHATTGAWTLKNVHLPIAGQTALSVTFASPAKMANQEAFRVSGLSIHKPSLALTKTVPPATPAALVAQSVEAGAIAIAKALLDDGTPANGLARVQLTITPTGAGAIGAFKLTDVTRTEIAGASTAAAFTGTAALPAIGAPLGLSAGDRLELRIDGGTAQVVQVFSPSVDAETLIGQINTSAGLAGNVTASRTPSGRFHLERVAQGSTKTLEILATSSAHMLQTLGLTPGLKASGYLADFAGVTASQPGGTAWSIVSPSSTWTPATGTATSSFTLRPPAAYAPGDGPTSPITVTYFMRKHNGTAATLGGAGTGFGPRINSFNLVAPYTSTAFDQTLNRTGDEPATVSSL
ncbi:MAG: carboxypeptidase regulatory-like domain-containing protein [Candidatus Sericytochromatia bacterium]